MIFKSTQQANGNKTNVTLATIDFPVKITSIITNLYDKFLKNATKCPKVWVFYLQMYTI